MTNEKIETAKEMKEKGGKGEREREKRKKKRKERERVIYIGSMIPILVHSPVSPSIL